MAASVALLLASARALIVSCASSAASSAGCFSESSHSSSVPLKPCSTAISYADRPLAGTIISEVMSSGSMPSGLSDMHAAGTRRSTAQVLTVNILSSPSLPTSLKTYDAGVVWSLPLNIQDIALSSSVYPVTLIAIPFDPIICSLSDTALERSSELSKRFILHVMGMSFPIG